MQVLELPYADGSASMIIVLPKQLGNEAFMQVENALQETNFVELLADLLDAKVDVALPRFEIEESADLKEVLPLVGLKDIFDPVAADLSGISEEDLVLSTALHKAKVKVNEEGTTAAAADVLVAVPRNFVTAETFKADRPFIYFIVDNASKTILFMGNVRQLPPETQSADTPPSLLVPEAQDTLN